MTKLYKEIEIKNKSRYVNTKASESYIDVTTMGWMGSC